MPVADDEASNRIGDVSRDLLSVAAGDTQARQDLGEDLRVMANDRTAALPAVAELSRRVSELLVGRKISDENARMLAQHLWTSTSATELSDRQMDTLRNDVHAYLLSMGVAEAGAKGVSDQVLAVQQAVTRPRRWYEFF